MQCGEQCPRQQVVPSGLGQSLKRPRIFPGVLRQHAHAFGHLHERVLEHAPFAEAVAGFEPHDGHRPEHQDEAAFLFEVVQHDVQGPFGNECLLGLGAFGLCQEDRIGVGADHRNVDQVHDDDGDDERDHLVDEVEG